MEAIDSRLFLFLNELHTEWLDTVMVSITEMWPWIPIYILLLYLVFKQYGKRGWLILLAVGLVILCSDQLSAHVCKPLFHRLRPCFNPELEGLVHLPKGLPGGQYGFVSSHAANTFAVAAFLTAAVCGLVALCLGVYLELHENIYRSTLPGRYFGWSCVRNNDRTDCLAIT